MTGPKALLTTFAMATGLVALALGLRGPYQRAAIEHLRDQLAAASEAETPAKIRELLDRDETGLAALVASLDAPRAELAQSVKRSLLEELARWQSMDDAASAKRFAQLASRLGKQNASFGPQGRAAARELALKMLVWRPAHDPGDRAAIVAECEAILAASQPSVRPAPAEPPAPLPTAQLATDDVEQELERATARLARLPGGGLAIDSFPTAPRLADEGADEGADASVAPHLLPGENPLRPHTADRLEEAVAFANTAARPGSNADAQSVRAMSLTEDAALADEDSVAPKPLAAADLQAMDEMEVMRLLQNPNAKTAAAGREELQRRGFGAVQIDLATRLFSSNSNVRRELARALPALRSIDPTPWLLWLARDEDAEVRLTAISLMATVSDPRLLAEIERMAASDEDPRIRRCAEQLRQVR